MSTRWDCLRAPVNSPICPGKWLTTNIAQVQLVSFESYRKDVHLQIDRTWEFDAQALTELAAFCTELAAQLRNK